DAGAVPPAHARTHAAGFRRVPRDLAGSEAAAMGRVAAGAGWRHARADLAAGGRQAAADDGPDRRLGRQRHRDLRQHPRRRRGGHRRARGAMSEATPVIRTCGLGKVYAAGTAAEVTALRGVDLTIAGGDFVAIMGPSGSGKSTLMNLLGCLDTPSSGTYECDGVDVSTLDAEALAALRREKIGFVFQGFHLLPRMDALHNVAMPLGYAGVPHGERLDRARAALEAVGLGERV